MQASCLCGLIKVKDTTVGPSKVNEVSKILGFFFATVPMCVCDKHTNQGTMTDIICESLEAWI